MENLSFYAGGTTVAKKKPLSRCSFIFGVWLRRHRRGHLVVWHGTLPTYGSVLPECEQTDAADRNRNHSLKSRKKKKNLQKVHTFSAIAINIARGTIDPGYRVHNSNHPNSRVKTKYYYIHFICVYPKCKRSWSYIGDVYFKNSHYWRREMCYVI